MSRIKSKKYTGVYLNELADGDMSYSITYKDEDNKTKRFTVGKKSAGITETYAYNKRNEFINQINLGEEPPAVTKKKKKNIITLDAVAEMSYTIKALHNKSNQTSKRKYEMHVSPTLGQKDITRITTEEIQKLQSIHAKKFAPKMVNTIIGELGTVYTYALENNIHNENPVRKVKPLKFDNKRLRYLDQEEINELLEYTKDNEQVYLCILLALNIGARIGALVQITPRDINLKTKTIDTIDEKNDERYTTFICNEELERLLEIRCANRKKDTPILQENGAKLYDQMKDKVGVVLHKMFNKEVTDPKYKVVPHTLRHTFASHLAINGTPIYTIKKLMNHKDINMTLRYAKLAPDTGRDAVEGLYN
ncbi:tyrosine-type recombinase/integrase [Sulfurimonas aquatica]|nr:site-specific integrase [Sulfurimonas aquatica]